MNSASCDAPYFALSPDTVMDAVDAFGFLCNGRIMALNSYENRVFKVGIEPSAEHNAHYVVVKFYRPERWYDSQIMEEHQLLQQLAEADLKVSLPMMFDGETLLHFRGFRLSLFTYEIGQPAEPDNPEHLFELGRALGLLHQISGQKPFTQRPVLDVAHYGRPACNIVLSSGLLGRQQNRYQTVTDELLQLCQQVSDAVKPELIRTHGDCHTGNMLWQQGEILLLDFDDSRMAPAMQDIWMLLSGDPTQQQVCLAEIQEGYEEFLPFPRHQMPLVESLRTLRIIHYSGWLTQRRKDPAFQSAFSHFGGKHWWHEHLNTLEQQRQQLQVQLQRTERGSTRTAPRRINGNC